MIWGGGLFLAGIGERNISHLLTIWGMGVILKGFLYLNEAVVTGE